ncbi:hypothetical protein SprV_0902765900 [Sparganum proliferum]
MNVGIFIVAVLYWATDQDVCCSGADTCCPQGTICNADGSCTSAGPISKAASSPGLLTTAPANITSSTTPIVPSLSKECASQTTPCAFKFGGVACCPFENAVCCNDSLHCCRAGYQCDATTQSCIIADDLQLVSRLHSMKAHKDNNTCSAKDDICDEWQTCCKMADGHPGCCPLPNAACCADGVHCCREGTRCNALSNACIPSGWMNLFRLPSTTTSPQMLPGNTTAAITPPPSNDSACPDGKSRCPEGNTCCLMADNGNGCCPSENAVCCSDGRHCCPSGFTCDNQAGTCVSGSIEQSLLQTDTVSSTPEVQQTAMVSPTAALIGNNKCDDSYSCEDNSTCCKMEDGTWGCCPLVRATCCEDKKHCCPEGYGCYWIICKKKLPWVDGPAFLPRKEKKPAQRSIQDRDTFVPCPDGHSKCPDHSTFFPAADKQQYGCCPLPNAVCCSDGVHCCPEGTQCDLKREACVTVSAAGEVGTVQNWFNKVLGRSQPPGGQEENKKSSSMCADGKSKCPDDSMCCSSKTTVGDTFTCCPFLDGQCCADGEHCCPRGYICDEHTCVPDLSEAVLSLSGPSCSKGKEARIVFISGMCPLRGP